MIEFDGKCFINGYVVSEVKILDDLRRASFLVNGVAFGLFENWNDASDAREKLIDKLAAEGQPTENKSGIIWEKMQQLKNRIKELESNQIKGRCRDCWARKSEDGECPNTCILKDGTSYCSDFWNDDLNQPRGEG